ncbi:Uncharacterized protein TCM_011429 [Theobroma cacao]|uniref:Uncharacterized protein n=1 Tax=Theobroma cacao TaxID=3641 RepID=A0A061EAB1_THECC|nr:Uncharacterized protein TCM_011429 [Theobroma cacao]
MAARDDQEEPDKVRFVHVIVTWVMLTYKTHKDPNNSHPSASNLVSRMLTHGKKCSSWLAATHSNRQ